MRFRCIEDHRDSWPVRVLCAALEVSATVNATRPPLVKAVCDVVIGDGAIIGHR
jgi:hypothetical protein